MSQSKPTPRRFLALTALAAITASALAAIPFPPYVPPYTPDLLSYDVPPQATVRLGGRDYGMYFTLTRYIPGINQLPATNSIQVHVTFFTIDGRPIPGNLPTEARVTFARESSSWLRRIMLPKWTATLPITPFTSMYPARSVGYAGANDPGTSWNEGRFSGTIEFTQRGRLVGTATATNLSVNLVPTP